MTVKVENWHTYPYLYENSFYLVDWPSYCTCPMKRVTENATFKNGPRSGNLGKRRFPIILRRKHCKPLQRASRRRLGKRNGCFLFVAFSQGFKLFIGLTSFVRIYRVATL